MICPVTTSGIYREFRVFRIPVLPYVKSSLDNRLNANCTTFSTLMACNLPVTYLLAIPCEQEETKPTNHLSSQPFTAASTIMVEISEKYGPEIQYIPSDTPLEEILALIKRDGGVIIKGLIPADMVDKAHEEVRERLDNDQPWGEGEFFPSKKNY